MVYQKTASILASGTTVWNTWRRDYSDVQAFEPDLHAVDLHQAHLPGIDLHEADRTMRRRTRIGRDHALRCRLFRQ